jgi:hypothetical protein
VLDSYSGFFTCSFNHNFFFFFTECSNRSFIVLLKFQLTISSLLFSAAVDQLKTLNGLHAVDDQSSGQAVQNTRIMLKILICIITIISNFIKLEPTARKDPHFSDTTTYTPSNGYLATSTPENTIPDALQHWQQKAIVLVLEAGCVNRLVGKVAV